MLFWPDSNKSIIVKESRNTNYKENKLELESQDKQINNKLIPALENNDKISLAISQSKGKKEEIIDNVQKEKNKLSKTNENLIGIKNI